MTASTEPSNKLLPCPFCGARARFEIDDECWEWVECSGCGIQGNRSASLMEGCKPKLAEAWNRRAQVARVPLSDEQIEPIAIDVLGYGALSEPDMDLFTQSVRAIERAHGITQEKQGC